VIGQLLDKAANRRVEEGNNMKELLDRLDFTERQLEMMTFEMKDKICAIVEDVEYKARVNIDLVLNSNFLLKGG